MEIFVPRQNAYTILIWCLLRSLGCPPVLADQPWTACLRSIWAVMSIA
jgi:hypothetical protein